MTATTSARWLVGVALGVLLVSCGGGDGNERPDETTSKEPYCAVLKRVQGDVSSIDFRALSEAQFIDLRDKVKQLSDAADGQIRTDWQKLGGSLDQLQTALDKARLTFEDLPVVAQGQVPNGADPEKIQAVRSVMQTLATDPDIATAASDIQADARQQCDMTLGGSSASSSPSPADTPAS